MTASITIELAGSNDTGTCDCCGRSSRCVWGYAYRDGAAVAAYYVHWTLGHVPDQGANIDLILGRWGDETTAGDRSFVALAYRLLDTGPSMMVIDAGTRPVAKGGIADKALRRDEVIGTSIAQEAFRVVDAVLAQDDRVAELLGSWSIKA